MAVREVERLGAALARQSGQDEDEAVRHLWGKLAILLLLLLIYHEISW